VLSAQEIRHCLFMGHSTIFLKRMSESKPFREATTGSINTKRMDDRECVLRYCAFHLTPFKQYNQPDFNNFLGKTMTRINKMTPEEIFQLEKSFYQAMELAKMVFGNYSFRKMYAMEGPRNPINKSLFESWSVCLEQFDPEMILKHKEKIVAGFVKKMTTDTDYVSSITGGTGGIRRVHQRFEKALEIIQEALS